MIVHLIDGTYELFRHHFAVPSRTNEHGMEVAAVRAVVGSLLSLVNDGATHVAVATDHVIPSFRNDMFDGYKDGSDIDPVLFAQFELLEEALEAAGFTVWPMVDFEADDAMAAGAAMAASDPRVERVLLCTPDKDLAQCVDGETVFQFDRRKGVLVDVDAVWEKFGVAPESIPDYLALVGDTADGIPGLAGWGAKSTGAVLAHYTHLESIPRASGQWEVSVRGSKKLADTFAENYDDALLYRDLATLSLDAPVSASVDELAWTGPADHLDAIAKALDDDRLVARCAKLAASRT